MAKDFLFDENGDIIIEDGDFAIGYSDEQHIQDLLFANKGEYKQFPLMGVGIIGFLKSPLDLVNRSKLEREINLQLEADGATGVSVVYTEDRNIEITADYGE